YSYAKNTTCLSEGRVNSEDGDEHMGIGTGAESLLGTFLDIQVDEMGEQAEAMARLRMQSHHSHDLNL
ncbi:unnamed protein product, partial [Mycena citricolor]